MKVFVTGATGFVGTYLVKRLNGDGHDVTALIHRTPPSALEEQLKGVEVVFYLAGVVSIDPLDEPILQQVNVQETLVDEGVPLSLASHHHPYDRSKAIGQRAVLEGVSQGLDAVVLNPVGIMGPEDRRPTPVGEMLLQLYHHSIPGLVAAGFHWVDVRDVVQGAMLALERGTRGQGYLLSSQYATWFGSAGLLEVARG